jgi:hypothetical protein
MMGESTDAAHTDLSSLDTALFLFSFVFKLVGKVIVSSVVRKIVHYLPLTYYNQKPLFSTHEILFSVVMVDPALLLE